MEAKRNLIRPREMEVLIRNGREQEAVRGTKDEIDHRPAVKLIVPFTGCQWLLSEVEAGDPDIAFGLCDLGVGFPELGSVWLPELRDLNLRGLRVMQVVPWTADKTLSRYAKEASAAQRIMG